MKSNIIKKSLVLLTLATMAPLSLQTFETPIHKSALASELTKEEHQKKWDKYNKGNPLNQEYFSKVTDTTVSPYQSIGSIFVKGKTKATASVVGKNKIITNYHIAKQADNDPSKIIFRPGLTKDEDNQLKIPFGEFTAKSIEEAPFGAGVDLAIITLNPNNEGQEIGEVVKPLEFGNGDFVDPHQKLNLIGYPDGHVQNTMIKHEIEVHSTSQGLKYFGYTEGGNSGSPILDEDNTIVGMHVGKSGIQDKGSILSGVLFSKNLTRDLKEKLKN